MRSTSKSSTIPRVLVDQDGNAHDAVISGSIVTRETGYDCRFTLQWPYESQAGTQDDAVVKRATVSMNRFIAFSDSTTGYDGDYTLFQNLAKQMALATSGTSMNLGGADLWAGLSADFSTMFANVVQLASNDSNLRDPDAAFITTTRPLMSGANS